MTIKNIVQLGSAGCRDKSVTVKDFKNPKIKRVIKNLSDSMIPNGLIGMAAPQLGYKVRIIMTHMRQVKSRPGSTNDRPRVFINPRIVWRSKKQEVDIEGCGSVANACIFGPVKRSYSIVVVAFNEKGEKFTLKAQGLLARIIQHENDHLDGIFFTDRITDNRKLMSRSAYLDFRKSQIKQKS